VGVETRAGTPTIGTRANVREREKNARAMRERERENARAFTVGKGSEKG
jgi:hypothetical protein